MIGETIKDFTITAQLGRGGMGEVFVAEQRIIKTKVAIKMLQPQISAEKAHVDRFFNEAIAVSKIKHAGIVKIFDVGFHQGRAYLVMECLEGETVSARLRGGVPFAMAIEIARQVTSVLDATHAAGITHRDLKPDNIFLVPDAELGERVRILDFGIAKLGDVKATAASMSMGTPAYMPPELWKDAATSGPATDVYALGCVVFELCCGRPPFLVTAVSDACGKHLTEIPPRIRSLRPELPAALDDLVAKMLSKEQTDRPTTKAIAAALASFATAGVASSPMGIAATMPSGGTPPAVASGGTPVPSGSTPAPSQRTPPPIAPTVVGHDADLSAEAAKLEAGGRWMELVKVLGKQAESADDLAAKAALHLRIATIFRDRFANMAEAIKSFERVIDIDPDNTGALDALRSSYEKRRDWEKLLALEQAQLDRIPPEERDSAVVERIIDLARLASSRVGKAEIVITWWQRVLDHDATNTQALAELAKLYERAERWYDLVGIVERQAEIAPGNDALVAAHKKLAELWSEQLDDPARAIGAWEHVLDIEPKNAEASRAIAALRSGKRSTVTASTSPAAIATPTPSTLAGASSAKAESTVRPARETTDPSASPSDAGRRATRSSGSATSDGTKKSPAKLIAIVGVVALAGGGIFLATRGSGSKDPGSGSQTPGPTGSQSTTGSQTVTKHGTGSQAESAGSQTGPTRMHGQVEAGASQATGSSATTSGLMLSYRVLSKPAAGGDYRVVTPNEELRTDDRLVFEVMVSERAHVFIGQRPKGKSISVLFPNAGIEVTNPLPANTWTRLPTGTRSFRLNDKDVGRETVFFVASRTPPASLAAAIANEGKPNQKAHAIEDQIVAVAMENRSDCQGRGRVIVLDGDDDCKATTRGVELDDDNKAKRVRGVTADDVVFVPFAFRHLAALAQKPERPPAKPPTERPAAIRNSAAYKACYKQCREMQGTDAYCIPNCEAEVSNPP